LAAGLHPDQLGELTALPDSMAAFVGEGKREEGEGKRKGVEKKEEEREREEEEVFKGETGIGEGEEKVEGRVMGGREGKGREPGKKGDRPHTDF